jgi:hypothetical protein
MCPARITIWLRLIADFPREKMGGVTMRRTISDYNSILTQNVPQKYTAEARNELYERARIALLTEFGKLEPLTSDADVWHEQLKLDFAIHDFEWATASEAAYAKSV